MNPFMLPEKDRMLSWRELRNLIQPLSDDEKFIEVTRWWAKAPICRYSIDAENCSSWPTPWELLNEGVFCSSGLAYMMAMTLILSGFDKSRISMPYIDDGDDRRLIVLVDGQIVLNYSYGEVFQLADIRKEFKEFHRITFTGDEAKPVCQGGGGSSA